MKPSISVVCPTYNSVGFVANTIQSVLQQTIPPFEFIVSDDGSSDDTVDAITRMTHDAPFAVCILRNPHHGPGAARNAGIRAAKGEWVAFLDADDRWKPEKIERTMEAILQYPEVNFFCHDQYHHFLDGHEERLNLAERYQHMNIIRQLFRNCPFVTSAVVCWKNLLITHGMFNESLMSAQDFELWLRLSPFLRVHFIPETLGWYFDRKGNISSKRRWRHLRNVLWALKNNKRNATIRQYVMSIIRHIAVFLRDYLVAFRVRS